VNENDKQALTTYSIYLHFLLEDVSIPRGSPTTNCRTAGITFGVIPLVVRMGCLGKPAAIDSGTMNKRINVLDGNRDASFATTFTPLTGWTSVFIFIYLFISFY
jgi:hypothetical protein